MEHDPQPHHEEYPSTSRHEGESIHARGVWLAALALAGLMVAALLIIGGLLTWLHDRDERRQPAPAAVPLTRAGPAVDVDQPAQLRQLRAAEAQRLEHYGWIDRQQQIIHVPIERAMQMLLEREQQQSGKSDTPADQPESATREESK